MNIFSNGLQNPMSNTVGEFHTVLLKLYKEPETIQLLAEQLYDYFGTENIERFTYDDGAMSFEIEYNYLKSPIITHNGIITIFCDMIAMMSQKREYNYILGSVKESIDMTKFSNGYHPIFFNIVNNCVTILTFPASVTGTTTIKINLHN